MSFFANLKFFNNFLIGQEKYLKARVLPNIRLRGRDKAVVTPRRIATSPLLPLTSASSTLPFSSSSDFLISVASR